MNASSDVLPFTHPSGSAFLTETLVEGWRAVALGGRNAAEDASKGYHAFASRSKEANADLLKKAVVNHYASVAIVFAFAVLIIVIVPSLRNEEAPKQDTRRQMFDDAVGIVR